MKGSGTALLVGVGVALAGPIIIPAMAAGTRPLAKRLVKGYLGVAESLKEMTAEAGGKWSDLVAEAKSEREAPAAASAKKATSKSSGSK